jgi:uncharacterized protein YukJ
MKLIEPQGHSYDTAIIVHATNTLDGIKSEYLWINAYYPGYERVSKKLTFHNQKKYDIIMIRTKENELKEIYFYITQFFGSPIR